MEENKNDALKDNKKKLYIQVRVVSFKERERQWKEKECQR